METYDTNEILRQARAMRAKEMRRLQGLMAARLVAYVRRLGDDVRTRSSRKLQNAKPASHRASLSLRNLFGWNPQAH
jgi:hypothetical protein